MRWLTSHYKDVKVPCFYVNKIFMKDFAEINFLWAVNITFVLPQNMNVLCVCNAWVCWVKNWTSSFECEVQSRNKLVLSDAPWSAENMPIIGQQKICLVSRKYAPERVDCSRVHTNAFFRNKWSPIADFFS